jgi:putative ATP-dependent endonuclease of the OLD family
MEVRRLCIRGFRGFEAATIVPAGHVVLVGEPGAGRSDVVEALIRVLSPDSTRVRRPDELDFHRRTRGSRAEVEVVLGDLGDELEQLFFDHLEVWDPAARQLVDQVAEPESIDRDRYEFVVRLCYRATWDASEEQGDHWVDYPKTSDPAIEYFDRVGRTEREALSFAAIDARSRPLDIGTRGAFRRLVERASGGDFSKAIDDLEREIEATAGRFSGTAQVSEALERLLDPLRTALGLGAVRAQDIITFLPEGGSVSGLLRSLAPALDLHDGLERLPLYRHGSTVAAMLSVSQALARVGADGVVAVDDFGEGLDAAMVHHLAAVLRRQVSQVWLSTRRPQAAESFGPDKLVRLTGGPAGRVVHYGKAPKTKSDLLAARHWHLQLLPAIASRAVVGVEGPHDRLALGALATRLHEQEGVELPAASRVAIVDAAAADGAGGSSAIPRLLAMAKDLGFRTVAILDYDASENDAKAALEANLKVADTVVRLPKGYAIERALVDGVDENVVRLALKELAAAFGVPLPPDLDAITGNKLQHAARNVVKHGAGYHAQFLDALPEGVHPPLARSLLLTAVAAATSSDLSGLVQL